MPARRTTKARSAKPKSARKARKPSAPKDERVHPREPIRLKVVYKSARSLVTEYTRSVSRGGCRISAKKPLEVGTRFVFDMFSKEANEPVSVEGTVVWCKPDERAGGYQIGIEYASHAQKEKALQRVLDQIFAEAKHESERRHPRVPVNLPAHDAMEPAARYLIRDLSHGGAGIRLPVDAEFPAVLRPRAFAMFEVEMSGQAPVEIGGEVVWLVQGRRGFTQPSLGVAFVGAGVAQMEVLDRLCALERPKHIRVTFGPRTS